MTYAEVSTAQLTETVAAKAGRGSPCASPKADPEEWFPIWRPKTPVEQRAAEAEAARLCAGCPVTAACLELAWRYEADSPAYGIWGGTREWSRTETNPYRLGDPTDAWDNSIRATEVAA